MFSCLPVVLMLSKMMVFFWSGSAICDRFWLVLYGVVAGFPLRVNFVRSYGLLSLRSGFC